MPSLDSPGRSDYDQEPCFEILIRKPFEAEMKEQILDGKTVLGRPDLKPEMQIPIVPGQKLEDVLEQILYDNLERLRKNIPSA